MVRGFGMGLLIIRVVGRGWRLGSRRVFGAGDLAGYLGLVHDVGKGACVWQEV